MSKPGTWKPQQSFLTPRDMFDHKKSSEGSSQCSVLECPPSSVTYSVTVLQLRRQLPVFSVRVSTVQCYISGCGDAVTTAHWCRRHALGVLSRIWHNVENRDDSITDRHRDTDTQTHRDIITDRHRHTDSGMIYSSWIGDWRFGTM